MISEIERKYIGKSIPRVEDPLLITGRATFADDVKIPGTVYGAILRSPYAHARIKKVDVSDALKQRAVLAAVTGEDARSMTKKMFGIPPGFTSYCLAVDKVRYVGEPVAAVAALTRGAAEDALEYIDVDYEPLRPLVDARKALEPEAPLVFDERKDNLCYRKVWDYGEVDKAFREADAIAKSDFFWNRTAANPIETFGLTAAYDPTGMLTVWSNLQGHAYLAGSIASMLNLPSTKLRLIPTAQGGSFGSKTGVIKFIAIISLLAKKTNRPVKWYEDRTEHLKGSASHGPERFYNAELATKKDGTLTAIKITNLDDLGAYAEYLGPGMAIKMLTTFTGPYRIKNMRYDLTVVLTNKCPQGWYRGYGVPAHNFVLERLVDMVAKKLGMDPAEIRRRNLLRPHEFPYTIPTGNLYDSGNYEAVLDKALEMVEYKKFREQQAKLRKEGRFVGIGVADINEFGVFTANQLGILFDGALTGTPERVSMAVDGEGKIHIGVGYGLEGQGQDTIAVQVAADAFGVDPSEISISHVDSLDDNQSIGQGGSRMNATLVGAILGAATKVNQRLIDFGAKMLDANPQNLEVRSGKVQVKGKPERSLTIGKIASNLYTRPDLWAANEEASLEATFVWNPPGDRLPPDAEGRMRTDITTANAVHIPIVEVDVETGQVKVLKYVIVEDVGNMIHPMIVHGMIQGGVAQGIGQALSEELIYDENGQLLTSTLMDYGIPTFLEVPDTEKANVVTPSPFTPLGTKGAGEGAVHGVPAAIANAVSDALAPLRVEITELPITPSKLYELMKKATK